MNIYRSGRQFLLISFFPVLLHSQSVTLEPSNPLHGQEITFRVKTKRPDQQLQSMQVILVTHLTGPPDTLFMSPISETWHVSTVISDTAVAALFYKIQGIDFQNRAFTLDDHGSFFRRFIYTENGKPFRGARLAEALVLGGFGDLQPSDPAAAAEAVEEELKIYPDNYQARLYKYTLILDKNGLNNRTAFTIRDDIENTLHTQKTDQAALRFAIQAWRMIESDDEAEKMQQKLQKLYPDENNQAIQAFNRIMAVDDAEEQTIQLENFIRQFPESRLLETALSQLASSFIELNDSTAMIRIGNRLLSQAETMAGASGLSALAGVLAEKKWQLETARQYISRALQILSETDPGEHPPEMSDTEWLERIAYTQTRYEDISGWIYFRQGDYPTALSILEKASANTMEPGILYHLAETLNALGQEEKAITVYARVSAFGGAMGQMAGEKLASIWQKSGRDPEQLESLLTLEEDQVQQAYEQKILNRRRIRPLPKFTLEQLSGSSLASSELRGENVLLCFWATWSDASAKMIDALKEIVYQRDDVRVLAVSVDRDGSEISQYVRDNRIPFQVLIVNKQAEQDFNLRGVPVLYVIDTDLRIHFEHKGYRPDLADILNIELDNLD